MKSEEQADALDREQTTSDSRSLKPCLSYVRSRVALLTQDLTEELMMSKHTLITLKIGLVVQYIGMTLLIYSILTNSWLVNGSPTCFDKNENLINGSEGLTLASLCPNHDFRDRFSGLFVLLEACTVLALVLKLTLTMKKYSLEDWLGVKLDDRSVCLALLTPRALLYFLLPVQSIMATNITSTFGSFLSIFRSPVLFLLSLPVRLITLPIALFFPCPLNDVAEIDVSKFAKHLGSSGSQLPNDGLASSLIVFDCFNNCQLRFESTWFVSASFVLLNSTLTYWFVGLLGSSIDTDDEGRVVESRENCSDGVEFIRVSEVSEDFSYEEEEEERKDEDLEKELNDLEIEKPNNDLKDENSELSDVVSKETPVTDNITKSTDDREQSRLEEPASKSTETLEVLPRKVDNEFRENSREVSCSTKATQSFFLKLNKGCQTFVPIHLHKKVNKKTQVSPIFVDAQTNTDAVKTDVSSVAGKEGLGNDLGRFQQSKVEERDKICYGANEENVKTENNGPKVKDNKEIEQETKQVSSDFHPGKNNANGGSGLLDTNVLITANGSVGKELFGSSELTLIPRTLDFERRIIRENQLLNRISVEAFLKFLEKEDDSDVVFVEKDLLIDTFRNIVLTTKLEGNDDAVCPRTGDLVAECPCRVHTLIKRISKREGRNSDEVDGLKMETEDDDDSDDESFFNGFRL